MKLNITKANRFLLGNLFWIVPLNFGLIIFGIGSGIYQRSKSLRNDIEIKDNISIQILSDSILKKNQDSILKRVDDFRNSIKK